MCREAAIDYFPRPALIPLARQYYRHGRGRAQTLLRHQLRPRPRQMAAPLILIACVLALLGMPFNAWFGLVPLSYAAVCVLWAAASAVAARDRWLLAMAPAVITVHLSWGAGFINTVLVQARGALLRPREAPVTANS
jgi:succinoglycan biosynthesis protein ExoA